jgi:hypothetical protein
VQTIRDAIKAGDEITVRILNYKRDGTPFWNMFTLAPMKDSDGAIRFLVGVQVRAEAAVRVCVRARLHVPQQVCADVAVASASCTQERALCVQQAAWQGVGAGCSGGLAWTRTTTMRRRRRVACARRRQRAVVVLLRRAAASC